MAYPTPPQTSSPKSFHAPDAMYSPHPQTFPIQDGTVQSHSFQQPYDPSNQPVQSQNHAFQQSPPSTQLYDQPIPTHTQSFQDQSRPSGQDTYFHSYSAPQSPSLENKPGPYSRPDSYSTGPAPQAIPHRRRSSPTPYNGSSHRLSSPLIRPFSPPSRKRSPGNPNYYTTSPLPISLTPRPAPSPYNLNRPQKRPGFWKRILLKLQSFFEAIGRWTKRNPITAGILTFFPVMTLAAIAKTIRVVGKGLGFIEQGHKREKLERGGSARNVKGEGNLNVRSVGEEEDDDGGILGMFGGFGGSKKPEGKGEGWMKVLQMFA